MGQALLEIAVLVLRGWVVGAEPGKVDGAEHKAAEELQKSAGKAISFKEHLEALSDEKLQEVVQSYNLFREEQQLWLSQLPHKEAVRPARCRNTIKSSSVQRRLSVGHALMRWLDSDESKSPDGSRRRDFLMAFIKKHWPVQHPSVSWKVQGVGVALWEGG